MPIEMSQSKMRLKVFWSKWYPEWRHNLWAKLKRMAGDDDDMRCKTIETRGGTDWEKKQSRIRCRHDMLHQMMVWNEMRCGEERVDMDSDDRWKTEWNSIGKEMEVAENEGERMTWDADTADQDGMGWDGTRNRLLFHQERTVHH